MKICRIVLADWHFPVKIEIFIEFFEYCVQFRNFGEYFRLYIFYSPLSWKIGLFPQTVLSGVFYQMVNNLLWIMKIFSLVQVLKMRILMLCQSDLNFWENTLVIITGCWLCFVVVRSKMKRRSKVHLTVGLFRIFDQIKK